MSDLSYEAVVAGLSPDLVAKFPSECFHYFERTGSTNDDLLGRIREGKAQHLDLVVADQQDHGRGRRGDRWEAEPGRNLLFSIAIKLETSREVWCRLPHVAAYVLGRAVESVLTSSDQLQAKWPNDLLYREQKLAGILVETVLVPEPFAVVGIGLNVNMRAAEFPSELEGMATSIYEIEQCESSRAFLLGELIQGFASACPDKLLKFEEVRDWLEERSLLTGRRFDVVTPTGVVSGTGRGLGKDGELLIEDDTGQVQTILSAERVLFR